VRRVEVWPDPEVALPHRFGLDGQSLRLSAFPLGVPFRHDLRADDEDGYSDQERVFQPSRFEREAEEPLQPDVDGPRETKDEHDERKQRRRPAEHLPGQETPNGLDVRLVELEQLRRTRGQGRRLAHRFPFSHPVNLPERGGLGSEQAHAAMFRALPSAPGTPSAADPPAPAATTRADTTSTTGFPASRACDRLRRRPRSHAQKLPCSRAKSSLFLRKSSLCAPCRRVSLVEEDSTRISVDGSGS